MPDEEIIEHFRRAGDRQRLRGICETPHEGVFRMSRICFGCRRSSGGHSRDVPLRFPGRTQILPKRPLKMADADCRKRLHRPMAQARQPQPGSFGDHIREGRQELGTNAGIRFERCTQTKNLCGACGIVRAPSFWLVKLPRNSSDGGSREFEKNSRQDVLRGSHTRRRFRNGTRRRSGRPKEDNYRTCKTRSCASQVRAARSFTQNSSACGS